jgi:hypothetical protein
VLDRPLDLAFHQQGDFAAADAMRESLQILLMKTSSSLSTMQRRAGEGDRTSGGS